VNEKRLLSPVALLAVLVEIEFVLAIGRIGDELAAGTPEPATK